jgi:MFS transporter, ACS family, glucarate transporter
VLSGLPFLSGAAGALAGGRLSDWLVGRTGSRRWGRSLIGFAGFTAAGACVAATGFAASAWQAVLLLCLASLVNDLAIPVIWAACADVGGRYAGTVSGLMNMAGGVGALLSPSLIPRALSLLQEHYAGPVQWRIIFAGMACAWFVGALAWLLVDAGTPLAPNAERGVRTAD